MTKRSYVDREEIERKFWPHVDKTVPSECWTWRGAKGPAGYGVINVKRDRKNYAIRAHVASLFLATGEDRPMGKVTMHSCDNRGCVNPAHLKYGSYADNRADCVEKGRHARGETHPMSKLTDAQVVEMRTRCAQGLSTRQLAEEYGIRPGSVYRITHGWSRKTAGGPIAEADKKGTKR